MYNYFNNSLWTQIGGESEDFWEELKHFREINQQIREFCDPVFNMLKEKRSYILNVMKEKNYFSASSSKWNKSFRIYELDCVLMVAHKYTFRSVSLHLYFM